MDIDPGTEQRVGPWLRDGPTELPDYVIQDVMQQLDATPQARRRFLGRWFDRDEGARRRAVAHDHPPDTDRRNRSMFTATALLTAAAVLAISVTVLTPDDTAPGAMGPGAITNTTTGAEFKTIVDAVEAAVTDDTITLGPGRYEEAVVIDKDISISGEGDREAIVITAPVGGPAWDVGSYLAGRAREERPYALVLDGAAATVMDVTIAGPEAVVVLSGGTPTLRRMVVEPEIVIAGGADAVVAASSLGTVSVYENSHPLLDSNTLASAWLHDFSDGAEVRDNAFEGGPGQQIAIYVGDDADALVEGNTITNPGIQGVKVGQNMLVRDEDGMTAIVGNTIDGASQAAIDIHPAGRASITQNDISGSRLGINATAGVDVIEGNDVVGASSGIVVGGGSPLVLDNSVGDSQIGITVGAGSSPELRGNRLCGTNRRGLVVGASAAPVVDASNEICDQDT